MTATQEIATTNGGQPRSIALREWDESFARLVKTTVLKPKDREATSAELALFAEQVQRTGLNPFLNQIYGIYRWDGRAKGEVMQTQVGIDGLRLIAERTGKYEGQTPVQWCGTDGVWRDVWLADEPPAAARVGVCKRGHREPTYAVAHWREYVQTNRDGKPTGQWPSMPANQLGKCAEALALRKCFPAEMSGLHTPEEMAQADSVPVEVVQAMPEPQARATDDQVRSIVGLCDSLVAAGALTGQDRDAQLVAAGALDTASVEAAATTLTTADADTLLSGLLDLQAAAENDETPGGES